jgi:CDP-diacylglycerol--glycerol-3-phosphate 3-phosphatidyltransferase
MERPERMVLLMIGTLFDRMAPVLWAIAIIGTITVIARILYTFQETKHLEDAQLRSVPDTEVGDRVRSGA